MNKDGKIVNNPLGNQIQHHFRKIIQPDEVGFIHGTGIEYHTKTIICDTSHQQTKN